MQIGLFVVGGAAAKAGAEVAGGAAREAGPAFLARLRSVDLREETGSIRFGSRYSEDQDALIQLAKDAKRRGGVPQDDANTLADWADELGLPGHGPAVHTGRPGWGGTNVHINIGPVRHIPVIK